MISTLSLIWQDLPSTTSAKLFISTPPHSKTALAAESQPVCGSDIDHGAGGEN